MKTKYQNKCSTKILKYLLKKRLDGEIIRFTAPAVGHYEITFYSSIESQKPELSVDFFDCCIVVFIDCKAKVGNVRCWCIGEAKEIIDEFLRTIIDAKN